MPTTVVKGAATAATMVVMKKLSQAEPVHCKPNWPHSTPKPVPKCDSVGLKSARPMSTTKPPTKIKPYSTAVNKAHGRAVA